jgi:two-component system phosphate regulon sensor histidine kinase PhoR
MKKKLALLIYLIGFTIFITIGIQVYWNYINFKNNKQEIINSITSSLDKSIEQYYFNQSMAV